MDYYRIRKEWNDGKWTSDQKGAYATKEVAISNCGDDLIEQGYNVYSPEGKIVYPVTYNPFALQMKKDEIITDTEVEYWSAVFDKKTVLDVELLKTVITSYSNKLNDSEDSVISIENYNGVEMISMSPEHFQIHYTDYQKSKLSKYNVAFNLGYFAGFSENGKYFTLPVANLVADIDLDTIEPVSIKYLEERHISDGKLYFPAILNASSQFKNKFVSTLVVRKNGEVSIKLLNDVRDENILYAVSGAPIIKAGEAVLNYKDEGWDDSITRATYHGFIGLKNNKIYYFAIKTTSNNCIISGEIYNKIQGFGFDDVIKVDGGGSFFYKNGDNTIKTPEDRRINNVGVVLN